MQIITKPNDDHYRICSVTGKKMKAGYCFNDGEQYAIDKTSAVIIANQLGYKTLEEAYAADVYYWTEWE